jgi:prepilin-type N-terminal cleavage/methylation domain-containing protein
MKLRNLYASHAAHQIVGARSRANESFRTTPMFAQSIDLHLAAFARKRAPTTTRGFTLIEVIVAIVIAALCFSALAGVFSGGMRTASTASELARASTLAQSLIATAGIEKPLADGVENGTSADGLQWTLTIAEESTESEETPIKPTLELKRISARVVVPNEAQPDRARVFELSTLRATPRPVLQP